MKVVKNIINGKLFPYIIIIALSAVICIPLFEMNVSEYNEARIHIGRIVSVKQIMQDGIFPNFISSKHMMGFGYALNIFYGVLTTYIPILISFITGSGILALKLFTLITVAISGIAMYYFVLELTEDFNVRNENSKVVDTLFSKSKLIALIASLIYIVAPYKLTDIYARTAVGEYTSFIFIPLVFRGLYKLINGKEKANIYLIVGAVRTNIISYNNNYICGNICSYLFVM